MHTALAFFLYTDMHPELQAEKKTNKKKENLHLEEAVLLVLLGHMAFTGKIHKKISSNWSDIGVLLDTLCRIY